MKILKSVSCSDHRAISDWALEGLNLGDVVVSLEARYLDVTRR